MKNIELRMTTEKVEVRGVDGEPKTIVGYGAVFNREAVVRESGGVAFREVISPGAFRSVLNTPGVDVFSLFNHSEDFVLGRTTAGTMRLSEDAVGLRYEVTPPTSRQDVIESLQRGDVSGSSFGFRAKPESEGGVVWTRAAKAGDLPLRTVVSVDYLRDVGPVTFPVFAESTAEVRSQAVVAARAMAPDDDTPEETAEEAAAMVACQECADACAAAVAACSPLLSDEDSGSCCREAVSSAADTMAVMGRAIASLGGQDVMSFYSSSDVPTNRARLALVETECEGV
jgi:uncharacterized protein